MCVSGGGGGITKRGEGEGDNNNYVKGCPIYDIRVMQVVFGY